MDDLIVRLTPQEYHAAVTLGNDTHAICQLQGLKPRDPEGKVQSEIDGARAEYAVAKLFGLEPPRLNIASDGGIDLWFDDLAIDVKFTKTDSLIFDNVDSFKADIAVLVRNFGADPRSLAVVGCVGREAFYAGCAAEERKYGRKLCMKADQLQPPERLWREVKKRGFQ